MQLTKKLEKKILYLIPRAIMKSFYKKILQNLYQIINENYSEILTTNSIFYKNFKSKIFLFLI